MYNDHIYKYPFGLGKYTPQNLWLEKELHKVDRSETPWLIVLMHSPLYNSYNNHYMEGEPMRVLFEPWFVQYKVDVVFAGHVHAYERSVSAPITPQENIQYNSHKNFISLVILTYITKTILPN